MSELAKGCEHFLEYRQNHGLQSFKIIYKYLVKPGHEARKLKVTISWAVPRWHEWVQRMFIDQLANGGCGKQYSVYMYQ